MFRLSDFLIYCFITAYSPGANNLLSMSNAMRLGFSRSIRFNFGITAGFSICLLYTSPLPFPEPGAASAFRPAVSDPIRFPDVPGAGLPAGLPEPAADEAAAFLYASI